MKALIVKNTSTPLPWGKELLDSISEHIRRTEHDAIIDVCSAADGEDVPSFSAYQLVVLTGGTFNLLGPHDPWVTQVISRVRESSKAASQTRLVGVCWGHQVIHYALGGTLDVLPSGPKVGVETIELTPAGSVFFGKQKLNIHKYHKRVIMKPAAGFTELAKSNEILISNDERTITFQGHPETTASVTQAWIDNDSHGYTVNLGALPGPESPHDGSLIWDKLMSGGSSFLVQKAG